MYPPQYAEETPLRAPAGLRALPRMPALTRPNASRPLVGDTMLKPATHGIHVNTEFQFNPLEKSALLISLCCSRIGDADFPACRNETSEWFQRHVGKGFTVRAHRSMVYGMSDTFTTP